MEGKKIKGEVAVSHNYRNLHRSDKHSCSKSFRCQQYVATNKSLERHTESETVCLSRLHLHNIILSHHSSKRVGNEETKYRERGSVSLQYIMGI